MKAQSPVTLSDDSLHSKRLYERQRKQRYRTGLRSERDHLMAEIWRLQGTYQRRLVAEVDRRTSSGDGIFNTNADNCKLKVQVQRGQRLLAMLETWVAASSIPQPRSSLLRSASVPWLHSTLLADPTARQYGYRWLTDRVFHAALSANAQHASMGSVEDLARVTVHTDTVSPGVEIVAIERHVQTTYFSDFDVAAGCAWRAFTENAQADVSRATIMHQEATCVYKCSYDTRLRTNVCLLSRLYDCSPDRVVLVSVFLNDDECFPLHDDEQRPHGFGWSIFENIGADVTLHHQAIMLYPPRTTHGTLTFDQTAAMFGVDATEPTNRQATLVRIEQNALHYFVSRWKVKHEDMLERLTKASDASDTLSRGT
ncbi:Aste57867_20498 [Aphanomyces stellatus]|uniref:Aste57867_20498 protein n=1 Tax=Aphanomyces stellatus TaxID=120398 RepID=A0A485LF81_9STRA|nr:hypothetical protein As57867_020432 [Aphanomyces stellatus]VFT97183.1 Aste57867_20498 [Aphanomyces stellatus]